MKKNIPFIFSIVIFGIYKGLSYLTGDPLLSSLVLLIPIGLLIFNLLVRKQLKFKKWFLSSYNFFLERKETVSNSEIPQDLLFEKLLEVVENSEFKMADQNAENFQILATTSPNFWTWGENIYIEILKTDSGSQINVTSITIFGTFSWKRNESNFEEFYSSFEKSLTI